MNNHLFSGIQPSGDMHIGNYLGAIKGWIELQHQYPSLFCIVDLHAMTMPFDHLNLHDQNLRTAASYLACGIDPQKSVVFCQSEIAEHCELMWIFSCLVSKARLGHMTQFKEKSKTNKDFSCGLYTYPLLMAADILLYNAKYVPVGKDQIQHLELTREIASNFNRKFNTDFFCEMQPIINEESAKIMSLQDGTKKMSKSDISTLACIFLADEPDIIKKKISKAKTDSHAGVSADDLENRSELQNLLTIFSAFSNVSFEQAMQELNGKSYRELKAILTDLLIEKIAPIREKFNELMQNQDFLIQTLQNGAERARAIAQINQKKIRELIGLV